MNTQPPQNSRASTSTISVAGLSNLHQHENNQKQNKGHVMVDPVLPKFEPSETSQGPLYDLSFELSNQNSALKTNQ